MSTNLFAGQQFEFLNRRRRLTFLFSGAATGIFATVLIGGVAVATEALISDSNRFPVIPEDVFLVAGGNRGARLFCTLRNSTGAPIVIEWLVNIL